MSEILTFVADIRTVKNTQYPDDRRLKCDSHTVEYKDESGHIYRKVFYTQRGRKPIVPMSATHAYLRTLRNQL